LEDDKYLLGELWVDADAVVLAGDLPVVADRPGGDRDPGRGVRPAELDRVADQVANQGGEQGLFTAYHRKVCRDHRPAGVGQFGLALVHRRVYHVVQVDLGEGVGEPADPGEREQVVDQPLHPLRAVDGEGDVLVGP